MSKAYDRISWNFLRGVLIKTGFPNHWVKLIMNCVTSVSYELLLNGAPLKQFKPTSGLRQGDPLSPYLFVLCMNVLSQNIVQAERLKRVRGIKVARNAPPISHMLFADDTIFFSEGSEGACNELFRVVDIFCQAAGQTINKDKSSILFSPNTSDSSKDMVKRRWGIEEKGQLGIYLGLPTDFGKSKKQIFTGIIEQVQKRLSSWNGLLLSPAGRLTLIFSVLSNLSIYFLSVFKLPVSVSKRINSLLTHFWWKGPKNGKTIHWCSKLFLGLPKYKGGLGIRNIGCLNQALLAKQAWKILKEPESLLGKVLGAKYGLTIDSYTHVLEHPAGTSSWAWKGILWGLKLIDKKIAWKIGRPTFLRTWEVKWVNGEMPIKRENCGSGSSEFSEGDYIADLFTLADGWDTDLIDTIMEEEWRNKVLAVPIPMQQKIDEFYWDATNTGNYTVKSGYKIALEEIFDMKASNKDRDRVQGEVSAFIRAKLWQLPGSNKWKVFIWKLMTNTLPLGSEFLKRGLNGMHHCHTCGNEASVESQEHLFRDCPISQRFWAGTRLGIRSEAGRDCGLKIWVINWLAYLAKKDDSMETTVGFLAALWTLWCNRNNILFRDTDLSYSKLFNLLDEAENMAWKGHQQKGNEKASKVDNDCEIEKIRNYYPISIVGDSHCCSALRIKVDAAWDADGKAGFGWAMLNPMGRPLFQESRPGNAESALQAEVIAIRNVLLWAKEKKFIHLWIASDCIQAILQIADLTQQGHLTKSIIDDILFFAADFHCCILSYVPRFLNRIAHNLAIRAKKM